MKGIEQERAALLKKEAKERATAESQSQQMGSLVLEFKRKAGEQGALYGSVTSMDRGGGVARARLRDRSSSHSPARTLKRLWVNIPFRSGCIREVTIDCRSKWLPKVK